jgi:hypothetical protein
MAISPLELLLFAANYVLTSSFVLALQRVWRGSGVNLPQAIWFTSLNAIARSNSALGRSVPVLHSA